MHLVRFSASSFWRPWSPPISTRAFRNDNLGTLSSTLGNQNEYRTGNASVLWVSVVRRRGDGKTIDGTAHRSRRSLSAVGSVFVAFACPRESVVSPFSVPSVEATRRPHDRGVTFVFPSAQLANECKITVHAFRPARRTRTLPLVSNNNNNNNNATKAV